MSAALLWWVCSFAQYTVGTSTTLLSLSCEGEASSLRPAGSEEPGHPPGYTVPGEELTEQSIFLKYQTGSRLTAVT